MTPYELDEIPEAIRELRDQSYAMARKFDD